MHALEHCTRSKQRIACVFPPKPRVKLRGPHNHLGLDAPRPGDFASILAWGIVRDRSLHQKQDDYSMNLGSKTSLPPEARDELPRYSWSL